MDEVDVVKRTTSLTPAAIETLFNGDDVLRFHDLVRKVPIADEIIRYAVQLAAASRPHQSTAPDFVNEMASWGAGTRAGQYLVLGAKARALLKGRAHVSIEDIQKLAAPVLRHRILLNYRAEANGVRVENIVERLLQHIKSPLLG
jgi:MoxR-like ATPase